MSLPTEFRKLGDADVNPLGFGLMNIMPIYGNEQAPDEERFKLLDTAHEQGCRLWDTADIYGDSEDLIGKWFKRTGNRSSIYIATKFGFVPTGVRADAAYVREAAEKSLQRLGVDTIDLLFAHRIDPKTPVEITVGAMAELVKEGKVRHLGLSEPSARALRRAHAIHPITAIQLEVSPFCLDLFDPKLELLKTARELGVKIMCYSPLGRGLATGRIRSPNDLADDDWRKIIPKFQDNASFTKIIKLVDKLTEIGKHHNATSSQVCLAWLLAQGDDFFVIPGTARVKYLRENISASSLHLTRQELQEITDLANSAEMRDVADRYPPMMLEQLFVDSPELEE